MLSTRSFSPVRYEDENDIACPIKITLYVREAAVRSSSVNQSSGLSDQTLEVNITTALPKYV